MPVGGFLPYKKFPHLLVDWLPYGDFSSGAKL